jgi:hypothetical protein
MAFAPDYASSGRFCVVLTARGSAWGPGVADGDILVLRGRRSADGDRGGLVDGPIVVEIDHAAPNHNGGPGGGQTPAAPTRRGRWCA